jgi:REP element-mobilizing transposase RayT
MLQQIPRRPSRLPQIFQKYDSPLFFVTFCTFKRRHILATDDFYEYFVQLMRLKSEEGIACGKYVIMPNHIHLFLRIDHSRYKLGKTVGFIKQSLSKCLADTGIERPYWQSGFFDHLLRSSDSYSEKWEYVKNNPVRAELVKNSEEWKYQGQIVDIPY